jgi:acyl carrier protein
MASIEARVKAEVAELFNIKLESLTSSTNLNSDLGADSNDWKELELNFRREFQLLIDETNAFHKLETVQDIIDYLTHSRKA